MSKDFRLTGPSPREIENNTKSVQSSLTMSVAWCIISAPCVCLSVCMYVCQTITFESLDIVSSLSHTAVSRAYGFKFLRSHRSKKGRNAYSRNVKLRLTMVLLNIEPWSLRAAGGFRTWRIK